MKMLMLIVSMAALAVVMYFYINSTMQQSTATPTADSIIQGTATGNGKAETPSPNTVPYEAQRRAAERLSKQLEKAKEAQDEQLRKNTGAKEE